MCLRSYGVCVLCKSSNAIVEWRRIDMKADASDKTNSTVYTERTIQMLEELHQRVPFDPANDRVRIEQQTMKNNLARIISYVVYTFYRVRFGVLPRFIRAKTKLGLLYRSGMTHRQRKQLSIKICETLLFKAKTPLYTMSDAIRSNYLAESKKDDLADSFNQAHVEDEDKVVEKTERKKRKRKARSVPAKKKQNV